MRREHVQFLEGLLLERAGQILPMDRLYLVESRLAPLARREGFASVTALIDKLEAGGEARLSQAAAEALVDPESVFFRDRQPFDQLRDRILPAMARARPGRPVRVWSAGCGMGQEAWSLAILAEEAETATANLKVEITATDFADGALEKARAGFYTHFEVQRGLPIRTLIAHFEKADDLWRVGSRLRGRVRWGRVNLARTFPDLGRFDVVLCRYLLKDFASERREAALTAIADRLTPGGVLILGEGESAAEAGPLYRRGGGGLWQRDPQAAAA